MVFQSVPRSSQANKSPAEEVVIETHPDRRIARVGGWEFSAWADCPDGEPRIAANDAARRLQFTRERNFDRVIEKAFPGQKINEIHVRSKVERTGATTRTVREYWLTEAQLLKVIARSRTEVAEAILDDMIRVYMLARRGLLGPVAVPTADNSQMAAAVESITRELIGLREQVRELRGVSQPFSLVGGSIQAQRVRNKVSACVDVLRRINPRVSRRSYATRVYQLLAGVTGHAGSGRAWASAPQDVCRAACDHLDGLLTMLQNLSPAQLSLVKAS